jgi:hypothetical protein
MRSIRVMAAVAAVAGIVATSAQGDPGTRSGLTAIAGQGVGMVEIAPRAHDVVAADTFDIQGTVNVHQAAPDTDFTVLRRVDFNPDGNCTGAVWMPLPAPNAQSFTTSQGGAGALHFEISRGAPLVDGVGFDVQWRLVGSDGSILESDCLTVTVK